MGPRFFYISTYIIFRQLCHCATTTYKGTTITDPLDVVVAQRHSCRKTIYVTKLQLMNKEVCDVISVKNLIIIVEITAS